LNHQKDTVLLHCCKNDILDPIRFLSFKPDLEVNQVDQEGRNAAMYLVENGRYHEFQLLTGCNIDLDYCNEKKNETLLSILIHCIYRKEKDKKKAIERAMEKEKSEEKSRWNNRIKKNINKTKIWKKDDSKKNEEKEDDGDSNSQKNDNEKEVTEEEDSYDYDENSEYIIPYIKILMNLVQMECNFNISIDEEGNTPLMFFIMIEFVYSVHYIVSYYRKLNVSLQNKYGETAFSVSLKSNNKSVIEMITNHPSFDFNYKDQNQNNLLMLYSFLNNAEVIKLILDRNKDLLNQTNTKGEHALMIATKLNHVVVVKTLLDYPVQVNQQDHLGNTALHYAVQKSQYDIINALAYAKADIHLKNNENLSPLDLAKTANNKKAIDLLEHPTSKTVTKLKKISKSKTMNFMKFTKKRLDRGERSHSDSSIQYCDMDVDRYKNVMKFTIPQRENLYKPMKRNNSYLEMENYGYRNVIQSASGVRNESVLNALTLVGLATIMDIIGFFN